MKLVDNTHSLKSLLHRLLPNSFSHPWKLFCAHNFHPLKTTIGKFTFKRVFTRNDIWHSLSHSCVHYSTEVLVLILYSCWYIKWTGTVWVWCIEHTVPPSPFYPPLSLLPPPQLQSGCAEVAVTITDPEPVILSNSPLLHSSPDASDTDAAEVAVAKQPEPSSPLQPGTSPVTAKLASIEVSWDGLMNGGCFN